MSVNPDLARILQALAESSRPTATQTPPPPPPPPTGPPSDPRLAVQAAPQQQRSTQPKQQQQQQRQQQQPQNQSAPAEDPSTITKYPASVRYVTTHIMSNPQAMQRLKLMKEHQKTHEKLWWQNREEIIQRHNNRAQNKLQMNQIFQNLGSLIPTSGDSNSDSKEELDNELRLYDEKMHKACSIMVDSLSKDLKSLGVPFYCCKDEKQFDPTELQTLKKKIVEFLDDMIE